MASTSALTGLELVWRRKLATESKHREFEKSFF